MDRDWTTSETSEVRENHFFLIKQMQYAYHFTMDWCLMLYMPELNKARFQRSLLPPCILQDRDSLIATSSLTFNMGDSNLICSIRDSQYMSQRLSDKLRARIDFGTRLISRNCVISWKNWYWNRKTKANIGKIDSFS